MIKHVPLSTIISADLKKALSLFCKKKGLKIQSLVETALWEQLEDEMDLADYQLRKNEDEMSLATVLRKLKKR